MLIIIIITGVLSMSILYNYYLYVPSNWMLTSFIVPVAPSMQVTVESTDTTICSWDTNTRMPFTMVLLTRVAVVLGFAGLWRVTPFRLNEPNANWVPPDSMYSSLIHARIDEPLVSQVMVTTSFGHRFWSVSGFGLVITWAEVAGYKAAYMQDQIQFLWPLS